MFNIYLACQLQNGGKKGCMPSFYLMLIYRERHKEWHVRAVLMYCWAIGCNQVRDVLSLCCVRVWEW